MRSDREWAKPKNRAQLQLQKRRGHSCGLACVFEMFYLLGSSPAGMKSRSEARFGPLGTRGDDEVESRHRYC